MKKYINIPTYHQWKADSSSTLSLRSTDKILKTIDDLVRQHDTANAEDKGEIVFQMYRMVNHWMKKHGRFNSRHGAMTSLVECSRQLLLSRYLNEMLLNGENLNSVLTSESGFGRDLAEHYKRSERDNPNNDVRQNYLEGAEQKKAKIVFRNGYAHERTSAGGLRRITIRDDWSHNMGEAIFTMDSRGRIYFGNARNFEFHHSCFTSGSSVLSAGHMKITNGVIDYVRNESGHYTPSRQQLANVVLRLRSYGVNMATLKVQMMQFVFENGEMNPKMRLNNSNNNGRRYVQDCLEVTGVDFLANRHRYIREGDAEIAAIQAQLDAGQ